MKQSLEFPTYVSVDWLASHFQDQDIKIIDGSWRLPGQGEAIQDYRQRHIPGALFFDIDKIADHTTTLPHMAPSASEFEMVDFLSSYEEFKCISELKRKSNVEYWSNSSGFSASFWRVL